ncbi:MULTISPECIES: hypothetical protein [unclassified Anaerobiospirillum]|uniref:hypothetical protein n=1 Tax=unclassified Anaerobiospirillum TaxID=2647410 RepID=UPI001FF443AD|nr:MULTISPECIES: hypothetical protein [unclassified Anaerobiospirillum]MCK0526711.1 hypothetical protein [Anaerobiospirillum sp. NML120449]MCK0535976.1 hypothetical protein [Anaerobiospirillum sp. NML120511]MCK0541196.1 hypothetical protein [Anaerobiospirillum sp. NML02-A-032]
MIKENQPKVPNLPPLIANGDASRGYYVCTYKNKWDSDKKRSVRIRSTSVGRVQGKEKFGLIEFYESFLKQYPSLKRFQVYRTDGPQRLVFIPKPPRRRRLKDEALVSQRASSQLAARANSMLKKTTDVFNDDSDFDPSL